MQGYSEIFTKARAFYKACLKENFYYIDMLDKG